MGEVASSFGGFLGIGPDKSTNFKGNMRTDALDQMIKSGAVRDDSTFQDAVQAYLNHQKSGQDTLNGFGGNQDWNMAIARDPFAGSRLASEEVGNDAILGQLYGQGGELSKSLASTDQLRNQGFQLTPEDHTAYGQASGDIARLFGSQENDLALALQQRGLASAPSGAAVQGYSGLMGNKNEQLAKAQMGIAQARMDNTLKRLTAAQQYNATLGANAAGAINQQYNRQMGGADAQQNMMGQTAGLQNAANQTYLQAAGLDSENKQQNLGDALAGGLTSGIGSFGKSAGQAGAGKLTGSTASPGN